MDSKPTIEVQFF